MCNGVEMTDDKGNIIGQDWVDCNSANCPLSKANPDNK